MDAPSQIHFYIILSQGHNLYNRLVVKLDIFLPSMYNIWLVFFWTMCIKSYINVLLVLCNSTTIFLAVPQFVWEGGRGDGAG